MGFSAYFSIYKKKYFTNMKMSPTFLRWNTQKAKNIHNDPLCPLGWLFYSQPTFFIKAWKTDLCWKAFDHSLNNFEGLNQWFFVTLGKTLTYTTSNLNNLRNYPEDNKRIDGNKYNKKKRHPCHDLPQD